MPQKQARSLLMELEQAIAACPGSFRGDSPNCPLKHSFADGIYIREMFVPKGMVITGKIHRNAHPYVLLKGRIRIFTEEGLRELEAPLAMISPPGIKRAGLTLEDTVWLTFHNVGEERDLEAIEKLVIAPDYETYDKDSMNTLPKESLCLL